MRDLMNWDEIRQMAAGGLIRFGSHTRTHMRLGTRIPDEVLRDEICTSRRMIEDALGTAVSSFCYPQRRLLPRRPGARPGQLLDDGRFDKSRLERGAAGPAFDAQGGRARGHRVPSGVISHTLALSILGANRS